MAHLWITDDAGEWGALPITGEEMDLSADPPRAAAGGSVPRAALVRGREGAGEEWLVMAGPDAPIRVGGSPVPTGLRVLDDKSEVGRPGRAPVFLSTERQLRVEPFTGAERQRECPRCKQPIATGTPAVRCPDPSCGYWHHQTDDLPCWTYASTCACCAQETTMNAGFSWAPEDA